MSHFTVLVIGEDVEGQLLKYDENKDTPRYVSSTKEELILKGRNEIKKYKKGTYAEYLKDIKKYTDECKNPNHLKYVAEEFPLKLKWTDEELYQDSIKYIEDAEIGSNGEIYSTYNPDSKWDCYSVGGRWAGSLKLKETVDKSKYPNVKFSWGWSDDEKRKVMTSPLVDIAQKRDIDFSNKDMNEFATYAVVKDGVWYEKGQMGWWGFSSETDKESDKWDKSFFDKWIKDLPDDTILTLVDCHI